MRANIDIDDALLSQAMIATGLSTKRATVEESLRLLVRVHEQAQALADIKGLGWDGDLDEMRQGIPSEQLRGMLPQLVADVTFYPMDEGGRKSSARPGWGCPCCVSRQEPIVGYDGWPLLDDTPLGPGEKRRLGFVFLSGEEVAVIMREAGTFYLWEGGFVGEAKVVRP